MGQREQDSFSDIPFLDPDAAIRTLRHIRELVPDGVYRTLRALLRTAPAPDAAVNQFHRLAETTSPELLRQLDQRASLVHYAVAVFSHSSWLGETLIQNPDLFYAFAKERSLDRSHSREEFEQAFARLRSRSFDIDSAVLLARFKRREYVRIMLRDVLGIATLAETTAEISALSDVLIEEALREVQAALQLRLGTPRHLDRGSRIVDSRFAVLSLGKLGGNELNYSSDIDLLYLYDGGQEPAGQETSNREYFIRLAQQVTELLSRHTREGPVFRIDLRLRPQGGEGEPAVGLAQAIHYYSRVAHDWERQAMIKARHSAGDVGLAREFIRAVQPYVYRPELNFLAIKTALETREKIGSHRRKNLLKEVAFGSIDVKLDRGGIRDIEFLVQCLQRVYGGSEAWLRSRGTLFALQKLHDKEHISGKDFQNLTNAYEFLRLLEHRLQLCRGQQTHRLPKARAELQTLSRGITREGTTPPSAEEFVAQVQYRMAAVQEIYQRIVYHEQSQDQHPTEFQLLPTVIATPESTYSQMLQRLAVDSPRLRDIVLRAELSQHARRTLDRFLSSAGTTSDRYGAVLRCPEAVERALTIFELSEFLSDILVRHPEEVGLLSRIDEKPKSRAEGLFPRDIESGTPDDEVFGYLSSSNLNREEAMAVLRQHYRRRAFLSGVRDLFHRRDVFDSLKENTRAADAAIGAALAGVGPPRGFVVMSLGRLGTREFDLLSDADVLFVCDQDTGKEESQRTAERLMEALTAYTRDGTVFPVDTRLRPHGREGDLIVTPTQLVTYLREEAKPWEALTYLKLRYVAGDSAVAQQALEAAQNGITEIARRTDFASAISEMRGRLERSESTQNLKTAAGGSYDIDYLAGFLQATHQLWFVGNLPARVRWLTEHGLLTQNEGRELVDSARFLRTVEHAVRLVSGKARKWLPVAEHSRRAVQKLLWQILGDGDSLDPEIQLTNLLHQTRAVYAKYLGA